MEEVKDTVEVQATNEQPQTQPEATPSENLATNHLVAMRRKLEAEEAARKEAERRAAEYERKLQSYNNLPAQESVETEDFGDLDDVATNRKIQATSKKLNSKLSESDQRMAALEQKLAYFEAKAEIDAIKDFNEIVTDDNLKTFARLYPEDYETVMANPNLKAKSKTAYNMIKNYGIASSAVNPLTKQLDQLKGYDRKIEANKAKPAVAASAPASGSPLTKYGRYEEDGRLVMNDQEAEKVYRDMRRKLGME